MVGCLLGERGLGLRRVLLLLLCGHELVLSLVEHVLFVEDSVGELTLELFIREVERDAISDDGHAQNLVDVRPFRGLLHKEALNEGLHSTRVVTRDWREDSSHNLES